MTRGLWGWAVERYDVVVVGSGIVGLLVAYELSKRGVSVTVVDENLEPGFGVSKGHAGVMHVIQPPFSSLKRACWQYMVISSTIGLLESWGLGIGG